VSERVEKLVHQTSAVIYMRTSGGISLAEIESEVRTALQECRREALKEAADYAESPETWKKLIQKDRTWGNITVAGKAIAEMIRELAGEERTK
jgi:hypothetical protein